MIKALKVVMIVWAIIVILYGLAFIFVPEQLGAMVGLEKAPAFVAYLSAMLGVSWIVPSVFVIIAARDPLRNIMWVKFVTVLQVLIFAADVYSLMRGYVNWSQGGMGLIIDAVFAVLFLVFYPWRAKPSSA